MYYNGQIVEGSVTGIQPYGVFVKLDEEHNGLLHISEVSYSYVSNIYDYFHLDQKVRVKIIDISSEDQHYKLSLKALHSNTQKRKRNVLTSSLLPSSTLGFTTLEEHLDTWIEQTIKGEIQ